MHIRAVCSRVPLIASGGVNQLTAFDFILAGATAIGVGGALLPKEALHFRQIGSLPGLKRETWGTQIIIVRISKSHGRGTREIERRPRREDILVISTSHGVTIIHMSLLGNRLLGCPYGDVFVGNLLLASVVTLKPATWGHFKNLPTVFAEEIPFDSAAVWFCKCCLSR